MTRSPSGPRLSLLLLLATLLSGAWLSPTALADGGADGGAFGVAPTDLDYGPVLREEPILRTIEVQNTKDETLHITLEAEDEMATWVTPDVREFELPPDTTRRVELDLEMPADVRNGAYNGTLLVRMAPMDEVEDGSSGVNVSLGIRVHMRATVGGDQIVHLVGGPAYVPTIETGSSLPVSMLVENRGNVRAAPVLDVTIQNRDRQPLHTETMDWRPIRPGATDNVTARLDLDLTPGQYWAVTTARLDGETLAEETITFDVLQEGELRRRGEMGAIRTLDARGDEANHRLPAGNGFLVTVPFTNTGEVDVEAKFKGYIALGDRIVRALESETLRLAPGENTTFRMLVTDVKNPGRYSIIGEVYYGGKVTPENEHILTLTGNPAGASGTPGPGTLLALAALGAAGLTATRAKTRDRR